MWLLISYKNIYLEKSVVGLLKAKYVKKQKQKKLCIK